MAELHFVTSCYDRLEEDMKKAGITNVSRLDSFPGQITEADLAKAGLDISEFGLATGPTNEQYLTLKGEATVEVIDEVKRSVKGLLPLSE